MAMEMVRSGKLLQLPKQQSVYEYYAFLRLPLVPPDNIQQTAGQHKWTTAVQVLFI